MVKVCTILIQKQDASLAKRLEKWKVVHNPDATSCYTPMLDACLRGHEQNSLQIANLSHPVSLLVAGRSAFYITAFCALS